MRADRDDSTLSLQVFNGRDGGADTSVISDFLSVEGDVDIASDQNFLSLKFLVAEVRDGLLGLKLEAESRGTADSESCKCKRTWNTDVRYLELNILLCLSFSLGVLTGGRGESSRSACGGGKGKDNRLDELHFEMCIYF